MDGVGPMQKPRWATGMVKVRPGALVIALVLEHGVLVPWRSSCDSALREEVKASSFQKAVS